MGVVISPLSGGNPVEQARSMLHHDLIAVTTNSRDVLTQPSGKRIYQLREQ